MSASSRSPHSGRSTLAAGPVEVGWIPPVRSAHRPPRAQTVGPDEWANIRIVIVLSLACTALSLYDLFLLAAGG